MLLNIDRQINIPNTTVALFTNVPAGAGCLLDEGVASSSDPSSFVALWETESSKKHRRFFSQQSLAQGEGEGRFHTTAQTEVNCKTNQQLLWQLWGG
jgi:hypothetical protein